MRKTNEQLCKEFRDLLTKGAETAMRDLATKHPVNVGALLLDTRPWRNDMWRAFAEVEARLCPKPQVEHLTHEQRADREGWV